VAPGKTSCTKEQSLIATLAPNPSSQGSFTDLEPSLRDSLRKARIEKARKRYIKELWSAGQVSVFLRPPRTDVGFDSRRLKGNPAVAIKIIEFSDFSCPYCKRVESTLKEVLSRYGGKVSLAYRDFPLTQLHPHAQTAAEAARCALEQGKFWEYHDLLFAHQDDLSLDILVEKARNLNMNEQGFVSCLNSGRHKRSVDSDIDDGVRAGVLGTPAFFINGVFLAGAQSEEAFEKLIDQELADLNPSAAAVEK
jgi:predicted DsbA family dithiol-disulfide isomerase